MLYCEKGTSVLFPPIDKVIQVYSCRVIEFFACPGKSKKTQKRTECRDDCIGPCHHKLESVCIDTDSLETSLTPNCEYNSSETLTDQTKEEKMLGTNDSTLNWEPPLTKSSKLFKRGKKTEYEYMPQDSKKIYRRRRKSYASRGAQSGKNLVKTKKEGFPPKMPSKLVNTNETTHDRRSLISLYRKRRLSKFAKKGCSCPVHDNIGTLENTNNNNLNFEMKPKNNNGIHSDDKKNKETCFKGICSKAAKNKEDDFVCTCVHKKEPGVKCSRNTCSKYNIVGEKCSFAKLKDKMSYLFDKSMQKLRNTRRRDPNKFCDEGVCRKAFERKNPNISCVCKDRIKKCDDITCTTNKKLSVTDKSTPQREVSQFRQKCRDILRRDSHRLKPDITREKVVVQNETEQTGEPFFEIKVNAIDMCVLNPSEIKNKVIALGEEKKMNKCVCPSHAVRKRYILEREACLGGACRKAFKNKNTDFSCKCLKNKIWTCTESTCNKAVTFMNGDICKSYNCPRVNDKPLFEVQVDNDNMCIINTEEMRSKLNDIHRRKNKLCPSGICKEMSQDKNTRIDCKCHKDMNYDECREETCRDMACRCDNSSIKSIKSKLTLFCARMRSKSDNFINRNKKRKVRTCKKRNGIIRTQSENVHKRDGLKIMIKRHKEEPQNEICPEDDRCKCTPDASGETPNIKKEEREFIQNKNRNQKNDAKESEGKNDENTKYDKMSLKRTKPKKTKTADKTLKLKDNEIEKNDEKTSKPEKNGKVNNNDNTIVKEPNKKKTKQNKTSNPVKTGNLNNDETTIEETEKKVSKEDKTSKRVKKTKNDDKILKTNNTENGPMAIIAEAPKTSKKAVRKKKNKPDTEIPIDKRVHKRKGLVIPVPSSKVGKKANEAIKKKPEATCVCHHDCQCGIEMKKRQMQEKHSRKKHHRKDNKKHKNKKKKKNAIDEKKWAKESLEKRREFAKERNKLMKEEKKRRKKQHKEELEVLRLLESAGGARRSNCFVEILAAIVSAGLSVVKGFFVVMFNVITKPHNSYFYVRERFNDPQGTCVLMRRTVDDAWRIRKLKVSKCFKNSDSATILSDTFKESLLYQTFADKGKTKKEQKTYEVEAKARKKRVSKRRDAALYGCRHILLNTLRKTPCLWVYHICPEFYPQCLSCLALVNQFWHLCLFVVAFICWTPCIVLCELTRGLWCCLLCTG